MATQPDVARAAAAVRDTRDGARPGESLRRGSHLLHRIDSVVSRPLLALVIVGADILWVAGSAALGFPSRLDSIFQTLVAALTLAIVFAIQHTQSREELVTQRKLDEILHALPKADNALIAFEEASDEELSETHQTHRRRRHQAVASPRIREQPADLDADVEV